MKVHEAVESLNVLDTKLDLSVGEGLILVEVSEAELKDSSLETIGGNLSSLCLGDHGTSSVLDGKDGGSYELVPLFFQKGVDSLLAASLFAFGQSLVLSDSHGEG
eukprot:Lithocolla_globosa_v1_NODE_7593_length_926_cov_50.943807.p2 type:complete len:105 gc:universal NODE_7593_length_926_cov_50.943807:554-868(+)